MKKKYAFISKLIVLLLGVLALSGCFQRSAIVSFDSNGGTQIEDIVVVIGDPIPLPDNPTKTGNTFGGWFMDTDLTVPHEPVYPVSGNMTLYAKWSPASFTITWDTVGGNVIEPSNITYRSTIVPPSVPTLEGYVFAGWYEDAAYDDQFDFDKLMPASNFTLFARWTEGEFKVLFDTKGGSAIATVTGTYEDTFARPSDPNKYGYTFGGWYLESSLQTEFTTYVIPGIDITLYAKWNALDVDVSFTTIEGTTSETSVKFNQTITQPADPTRVGYTFVKWVKHTASGDVDYNFSEPVTTENEINLWAVWDANEYQVTFVSNDGSAVSPIIADYQQTIHAPSVPTKTGHTFMGWYSDVELQTLYTFNQMPLSGITLYAGWDVNEYQISFISYGGDEVTTVVADYEAAITQPVDPEKDGYTFGGWYLDSNFSEVYSFPETMPAQSVALHALWNINSYTITYMVDGTSYDVDTYEFGADIESITAPTRIGNTFSGWGSVPETMPASDVIVYGTFSINSYDVTYYVDSEVHTTETYLYGGAITPIDEPTKEGYTFSGWSTIPATMPAQNLSVHGTFGSPNSYTLNYKVDEVIVQSSSLVYGTPITPREEPTTPGYTFSGWSTIPETMPASDVTISGTRTPIIYNINYEFNGGTFDTPQPTTYIVEVTTTIANPLKPGYTFTGWTYYPGQVTPVKNFIISMGSTGDWTLTANWSIITYTISYYDGSTSQTLIPATYTVETGAVLPEPTKTGHTFMGWFENSNLSGTAVSSIAAGVIGNKIFYADYAVNNYTVFYYDGAQLLDNPTLVLSYDYNALSSVSLVGLQKTGHNFNGWYDNSALTGSPVTKIETGSIGNITLYASYTVNVYDVTFYTESGRDIVTMYNVEYGTSISLLDAFVGEPANVAKLIELNQTLIGYNMGAVDYPTLSGYLTANAAALSGISENMATALYFVSINPGVETMTTLMNTSSAELARLGAALDVKISLLQSLKDQMAAVVDGSGDGTALFMYVYASQGAYLTYSSELNSFMSTWLDSTGSDNVAFQSMYGLTVAELEEAARLRTAYASGYPAKDGYTFSGWRLGTNTAYLGNNSGYVISGTEVFAPATTDGSREAHLVAAYSQLGTRPTTFYPSTNVLSWTELYASDLSNMYDITIENLHISYDIYMKDSEGNISWVGNTSNTNYSLTTPGTYVVFVIPVVEVYRSSELVRTITASINDAVGENVTVKKSESTATIEGSGNYYYKVTELVGGETVFYFFSNTEITFAGADFTILSGDSFVSVTNNSTLVIGSTYTTGATDVSFTFTASDGGTVYTAKIFPYISQFNLGDNFTSYLTTTGGIGGSLYYDKSVDPYTVGIAYLSGGSYYDILNNDNAFHFPLLVKTTGGRSIELPDYMLEYSIYRVTGGTATLVPFAESMTGDWEVYKNDKDFFFQNVGVTYRVDVKVRDYFVPLALSGVITSKSFTFTTNDGVNVFTNTQLQTSYSNLAVHAINLHSNIEAQLRAEQTYEDPDDGIVYPYNYGSYEVLTLLGQGYAAKTGNVYQRISPADSVNPDYLTIYGNYFTVDGSKLPTTNYDPGSENIEGSVGVNQVAGLSSATAYQIRNVQLSIFYHMGNILGVDAASTINSVFGGVNYHNLTVIGNTKTPSVNFTVDENQIDASIELMGKNSGGYVAIRSSNNTIINTDNVVVGSSTIGFFTSGQTVLNLNNATIYNSWANSVYGHGVRNVSIQNSNFGTSGGAAIHIEDTNYSSEYKQSLSLDTSSVQINNWVSGEESWFKAYSMELAAMQMKAQINSSVDSLGSILRTITDPSTGLISRKMNFVLFIMPEGQQLNISSNDKANIDAADHGTAVGYSDITLNMIQSGDYYPYDMTYTDGKYLVPISEDFFAYTAQPGLPFGDLIVHALPDGTSTAGATVASNYLGVQADMSSVGRGHAILIVGLDNRIG